RFSWLGPSIQSPEARVLAPVHNSLSWLGRKGTVNINRGYLGLRIQNSVCVETIAKVKRSSACGVCVCFCGRMSRAGFDASGLCDYADSHECGDLDVLIQERQHRVRSYPSHTDATGKLSVPVLSAYHTFNFFGRSANLASLGNLGLPVVFLPTPTSPSGSPPRRYGRLQMN